jgi:gas vesicle protein
MASNNDNGILAFLVGAAIGVGFGILYAPDKGSKTREKLKDNFEDLSDEVKSKINSVSENIQNQFSRTKEDFKESFEEVISNSSEKAEEVIAFLEEKLAALKKQNSKLQK